MSRVSDLASGMNFFLEFFEVMQHGGEMYGDLVPGAYAVIPVNDGFNLFSSERFCH